MKIITALVLSVSLTGCAAVQEWIPSFWDDNQSAKIIDIRQKAHNIACDDVITQKYWSGALMRDIQWFELYSDSKGSAQKDVLRLVAPMKKTVQEWNDREAPSKAYCELKKKIIKVQADKAANAVHWRF